MKKRISIIVLCLCIALAILPVTASAQGENYVALGDSISGGYGLSADESSFVAQVTETNGFTRRDFSTNTGETSQTLRDKVENNSDVQTALQAADVVTITVGGNDLMNALYQYLATKYNEENSANITPEEAQQALMGEHATIEQAAMLTLLQDNITDLGQSQEILGALSTFSANLQAIIEKIQILTPQAHIIIANQYHPYSYVAKQLGSFAPQLQAISEAFQDILRPLNQTISAQAQSHGCSLADVYDAFETAVENGTNPCNAELTIIYTPPYYSFDPDFHPNAAGHEIIATAVNDIVAQGPVETVDLFAGDKLLRYTDAPLYATTDDTGAVTLQPTFTDDSQWNIKWDGATLTLQNANVQGLQDGGIEQSGDAIDAACDLTVNLIGNNTLTGYGESSDSSGIAVAQDHALTIQGQGSLIASGSHSGLFSNHDITISGGQISANGTTYYGLYSDNNITISGGELTANGGQHAVYAEYGNIYVSPGEDRQIAVKSGANAASAQAISGSPFTTNTNISNLVEGNLYFHSSESEQEAPSIDLYAGDQVLCYTGTTLYATTDDTGKVTLQPQFGEEDNWNIKWDGETLTLQNANVQGVQTGSNEYGDAISAACDLTVNLIGNNTLTGDKTNFDSVGIAVVALDSKLTIQGQGSLIASGAFSGLFSNHDITISGGKISASGTNYGVVNNTNINISGGELTASGGQQAVESVYGLNIIPGENWQIAVKSGANAASAQAIDGSPFTTQTDIYSLVGSNLYFHSYPVVDELYRLTIENGGDGATADGNYTLGQTVSVTAGIRPGYTFIGWTSSDIQLTNPTSSTQTFSMPSHDVKLTALWRQQTSGDSGSSNNSSSRPNSYVIKATQAEHGSVETNAARAESGDTVIISVQADDGYELQQLTVTDEDGDTLKLTDKGNNKYSFIMPDSRVTVEAEFAAVSQPILPFQDVPQGIWYEDAARYAYENGLMNGTSATTFSPNLSASRAMIVTILYRLAGEPATASAGFSDVAAGAWYDQAIGWAAANDIVSGYGDGSFGPNDPITREQMAAILYRYAVYQTYDVSDNANLSGYTDASAVSAYAQTAMSWAVGAGLLQGVSQDQLSPQGPATRAQVAAILMRFCQNIAQ